MQNVLNRFFAKVHIDSGSDCLIWKGALSSGYGKFYANGSLHRAHKFIWEFGEGRVPDGFVMDHLCRNRACVNTSHLRVVTVAINCTENSTGAAALNKQKTHCYKGHVLDVSNTWTDKQNRRMCKICRKAWMMARPLERIAKYNASRRERYHAKTGKGKMPNGPGRSRNNRRGQSLRSQDSTH